MTDPNPNRISPDGGPVATPAQPTTPTTSAQPAPHDVPFGVKLAIAGAIPGLVALGAALPPPWNLVCVVAGASVGGIATFLGMATGSEQKPASPIASLVKLFGGDK